jgi:GDP-4-dehydro-6-deoxy-D-mannose reductase
LLVTGADGFVGRWLVRSAHAAGHDVVAAIAPESPEPEMWLGVPVPTVRADITDAAGLAAIAAARPDAVVHLAAIASGADARRDPVTATRVNVEATVALLTAIAETGSAPDFLFVSTGEVYGAGHEGPITEHAPVRPVSDYASSKAAAEAAVLDLGPASGMRTIVARPFPHSGPGQDTRFVLPAFAARLQEAKRAGEQQIPVGNLDVVRDFLDVRDVVRAYLLLLAHATSGEVYNVASGVGQHLGDCFVRLAALTGVHASPVEDPALVRPADIAVLIGDPTKLRAATGWSPSINFDQTLQDVIHAQAH